MRLILAIIYVILLAPVVQTPPACLFATSDLVADLALAQAGPRCLDIPAGVYTISSAAGSYLNATADQLEIRGAGIGKTILQTQGVTLTNNLQILMLHGVHQRIHDLTIQIGAGYSGAYAITGISIYDEATGATIERVEISGGYTPNGSNGAGMSTYRTWNHAAQYVTIRDSWLHDMPTSAIVVNSSNNLFLHNRIERVGASGLAHGFYSQGGYNLYDGNTIDHASGWSFHGHKAVPNIDSSGDRFVNNMSIDPGMGHVVVNSLPNASNPALPIGVALDRYATISNNTFRNTLGRRSMGVWANGVPTVISGNTLEDVFQSAGGGWIDDNAGSIIEGNILSTSGIAPDGAINQNAINVSGVGALVTNNRITLGSPGGGIRVSGARHRITNNALVMGGSSGAGLILTGDALSVVGNNVEATSTAAVLQFGTVTNILLTQNYFHRAGGLGSISLATVSGRIGGNLYADPVTFTNVPPGVVQ